MSSPSIQDFVEKIEAELCKPPADRRVELIEFWEGQIRELRSADTTSAGNIHFILHMILIDCAFNVARIVIAQNSILLKAYALFRFLISFDI